MRTLKRHLLAYTVFLALTALLCPVASQAQGQTYPDRPVRLIVPFPPGGGLDVHARMLAARLSEEFRQQVVVDNRPGAGSFLGANVVAKAKPDGYTLLITTNGLAIAPALYRKLSFDPMADLVPVTQTIDSSMMLW